MNAASRVLNFLVSPLLPVIGALFSSEVEKLVALAEIDQQDEIEERARNLEAEGKTHLASRLRQRASQISTDRPGHYGTQIIGHLEQDCKQLAGPQPGVPDAPKEVSQAEGHSGEGRTKRRAQRRSKRTSQADQG